MITIKEALPSELNIISDIACKTWPATYGEILSDVQLQYMLNKFYSPESLNENISNGHHFLIASANDVPLGFASYVHNYGETGQTKIPKIYMLPESQGKGIGKLLIGEIEKIARKNQATKLTLNVNRFNKAISFYQYMGFEIAAEEVIQLEHGFVMDDYIMAKPLA